MAAILLAGCATSQHQVTHQGDHPASAEEIAKWRDKNGLDVATKEDIESADRCEARFIGQRAKAANGGLQILFNPGKLVGSGCSNLSTTSTYSLLDGKNRKLASGPSCIASGYADGGQERGEQRAWFAPDGKVAVLHEYTKIFGTEPLTIVFYKDEDNQDIWRSKFLRLPVCGLGIYDEGAHAECRGLAGDELLFDADTQDGKVSKKKIKDLEEHYPFPFTIG